MYAYDVSGMTNYELKKCYSRTAVTFLAIMLATQLLAFVGSIAYYISSRYINYSDFQYQTFMIAINEIACYLPGIILIPLLMRNIPRARKLKVKHFNIPKLFTFIIFAFGMGYLFNFINIGFLEIVDTISGLHYSSSVAQMESEYSIVLVAPVFIIIAPLCEELIFRKLLLERLRGLGDVTAVVLSALLFGLFHANFTQTLYAFILGMILACIVLLTGSIFDSFLVHAAINAFSVLLSQFAVDDASNVSIDNLNVNVVVTALAGWFVIACIVASVVIFFRNYRYYHFERGVTQFSPQEKLKACLTSVAFWVMLIVMLAYSIVSIYLTV